ncbi:MAG: hypothetical protein AAGD25_14670 [Cyanobacteria bacterium P01_F01_bin.150]
MRFTSIAFSILAVTFLPKLAVAQTTGITSGVYNAGSRYISVAHQGERTCYQGISIPPGRYAIAVGETTGSLSYDAELNSVVVDGWQDYGKNITLTQQDSTLVVNHDGNFAGEYTFGENEGFGISEAMTRCLNASEPFFETAPGYTISLPRVQNTTVSDASDVAIEETDASSEEPDVIVWADVPGTQGELGYLGQVGKNTINRDGDQITFDMEFDGMYGRFNGNCRTKVLYPLLQDVLDRDGQPVDPQPVPYAEWFQPGPTMVKFLDMACSISQ